jgi:hypothetical protein
MRKLFLLFVLFLSAVYPAFSETRYVTTSSPMPNTSGYYYGGYNDNISRYNYNKLEEIENSMYGRNFVGENLIRRLERLENTAFNHLYPNTAPENRIANLIYYYNKRNVSNNTTSKLKSFLNGLSSNFIGVPTGYTPPIDPYYYGASPNYGNYSDYYGNNGWYRNGKSVGSGGGVHIID